MEAMKHINSFKKTQSYALALMGGSFKPEITRPVTQQKPVRRFPEKGFYLLQRPKTKPTVFYEHYGDALHQKIAIKKKGFIVDIGRLELVHKAVPERVAKRVRVRV